MYLPGFFWFQANSAESTKEGCTSMEIIPRLTLEGNIPGLITQRGTQVHPWPALYLTHQTQLPPHYPRSTHLANASLPRTGPGIPPPLLFLLFLLSEMPCSQRTILPSLVCLLPYTAAGAGVPMFSFTAHIFPTATFIRIVSIYWALTVCQAGTLLKVYILLSYQSYKVSSCFSPFHGWLK